MKILFGGNYNIIVINQLDNILIMSKLNEVYKKQKINIKMLKNFERINN